jgi:Mg-chelatase subunit ChlD
MKPDNEMVTITTISKLASMLSSRYGVKITISGGDAYTNFSTKPPTINLPLVASGDGHKVLLRGYIDHEVGHIRYTKMPFRRNIGRWGSLTGSLWNICEDVYIERAMSAAFKGCAQNLRAIVLELFDKPVTLTTGTPALEVIFSYILYGCRGIPVKEIRPHAMALRKVFPFPAILPELDKLILRSAETQNSDECFELAGKMTLLIKSVYKPNDTGGKKTGTGKQESGAGAGGQQSGAGAGGQQSGAGNQKSGTGSGEQLFELDTAGNKKTESLSKSLQKDMEKVLTALGTMSKTPLTWSQQCENEKEYTDLRKYNFSELGTKFDSGRVISMEIMPSASALSAFGCHERMRMSDYRKMGATMANPYYTLSDPKYMVKGDRLAVQLGSRIRSVLQTRSLTKRGTGSTGLKLDGSHLYRTRIGDTRVFRHDTPGRTPDIELIFLMDSSGSMHGKRQDMVNYTTYAVVKATQNIRGCRVGVVSFNSNLFLLKGLNDSIPPARLAKISAFGNTQLGSALVQVLDMFTPNARRHAVVMMTDGRADDLPVLNVTVNDACSSGIDIMALGVGSGGRYIKDVVERNGGYFRAVDKAEDIPEALLGMLGMAVLK